MLYKFSMIKIFFIICIFLNACSKVELSREGAEVTIEEGVSSSNCEFLGNIESLRKHPFSNLNSEELIKSAEKDIRNKAAILGANAVQILELSFSIVKTHMKANIYKCDKAECNKTLTN